MPRVSRVSRRAAAVGLLVTASLAIVGPASTALAENLHLERARELYLEVEFDPATTELQAALRDLSLTDTDRRESLMLLGIIQVANRQLSAATHTFAEVQVRWPDFIPTRDTPPNARQVFAAVPQGEIDRVRAELEAR